MPPSIIEYHPDLTVGGVKVRERASRANRLLSAYARETGADDIDAALADFMGDALHLMHSLGVGDFEQAVHLSRKHHAEESDIEAHEGEKPPPPFVTNKDLFPIQERYFIVSGRISGADEDTVQEITIPGDDDREAWEYFVEEILYDGDPPDFAMDDDNAFHNATFELETPSIDVE